MMSRRSERGATAVVVAILMVVLLGFAAIAIDLGAMWSTKKQMQNGADAAALAIAQACVLDPSSADCANPNATAQDYANRNRAGSQNFIGTATVNSNSGVVRARVTTARQNWFAPIFGADTSDIAARAAATYGYPFSGSTLPLAVSICEFWWQTKAWSGSPPPAGTPIKIKLMTKVPPSDVPQGLGDCGGATRAAHNETSGGFGWLSPTSTNPCYATATVGGWVSVSTGGNPPCSVNLKDGQVVQIPLFYETLADRSGSNAQYHLKGFAAIKVVGWCFSPNSDEYYPDGNCTGENRHIRGTFVTFVGLDGPTTTPTAPNFGDAVVTLTTDPDD